MLDDVKNILAKNVTWPKTDKEDRTHDKPFMKQLALSIEADGLIQAIGVRPDKAKGEGFYIGIFGRHRHGAFLTELKRDLIPAVVFPADMTDEEASVIQDVENLWRNPLKPTQHARALARWHTSYDAKRAAYTAAVATNKAAEKAAKPKPAPKGKMKTQSEVQSGPTTIVEPPAAEVPAPAVELVPVPEKPPENFAKHVAAVTGQSETGVKRALKIGKAFTPAQLEVIEQQGVNQTWQDTIAGLPKEQRDGVVNLIAAGRSEEDAIATIQGSPEVKRADGKAFEVAPVAPGQKDEKDMTDEEWVNFHCPEMMKLLEDPTAFVAHAILYRATRDARQALKSKAKAPIVEAKKSGVYGGFYALLNRLLTAAHPSKWVTCGTCKATGFVQEGTKQSKCKECSGNAFVVRFEGK